MANYKQKSKQFGPLTEDELKLSFDAKIYRKVLDSFAFSDNPLALYNHWVQELLPKQIMGRIQVLERGYNTFSNIKIYPVNIYPQQARNQKESYSAMITATITFTPRDTVSVKPSFKDNCELGKIPVMVGSKLCKLYGLSDEERVKHGECFNDKFGYFIIKGAEKIIVNQEQLGFSQPITYLNKSSGKYETRFTSHTDIGTSLLSILVGKEWKTLEVKLFSSLGKHIPLFVLYEIILKKQYENQYIVDHDTVVEYALNSIYNFVKEEDRERVKFALYPSIAELKTIPEDGCFNYILHERHKIINKKLEAAKKRKKNINTEAMKDSVERIWREIMNDLFPNVPEDKKIIHLSMITAQMVLTMVGVRPSDNRDGWENKSLQVPANSLEQLFNAIWTNFIEGEAKDNTFNVPIALITDGFVSAFGPNSWGAKNATRKENIVNAMLRESTLSIFSQIAKTNTPASRQLRESGPREIHGSQNGYLCLPETPEGTNCGLVKYLASSCWVSLRRDYTKFIEKLILICDPIDKYIVGDKSPEHPYPLTVNGIILGWCNTNGNIHEPLDNDIFPILRLFKRDLEFFDLCIYFNKLDSKVEVYIDGSRPTRPLYTTNYETKSLVIDSIPDKENKTIAELIALGAIEYIHSREQENLLIAMVPDLVRSFSQDKIDLEQELIDFNISSKEKEDKLELKFTNEPDAKLKSDYYNSLNNLKETNLGTKLLLKESIAHPFYEYSNIDPNSVMGIVGCCMPQANFCQGPRVSYQCSMFKQALGPLHSVKHKRWDAIFKCLLGSSRPLFETEMSEPSGLNALPCGYTPIIAFVIRQNNNEDAFEVKKQFIQRFMRVVKYTTHTVANDNPSGGVEEKFTKPKPKEGEKEGRYDCIDDNGIPIVGAYIRRNDCIIGRIRKTNKKEENASIFAGVGDEGIVDSVLITKTPGLGTVVRVKVRSVRTQQMGDKLASRYAQKGTIGSIKDEKDMLRVVGGPNDGLVPDICVNTLATPSRMTIGMLHEVISSMACLYDPDAQRVNSTSFKKFDLAYYQNILEKNGMDKNSEFTMANSDGTILKCPVFLGPCYYQALRHHVVDKFQARSTGSIVPETHQPLKGRSNDGGLRFGEMERDSLISHGAAYLLSERLMYSSDRFTTEYCYTCGNLVNPPFGDNPIECKVCKFKKQESRVGTVTMPFIFLLITRMLLAMGMHTVLKIKEIPKFTDDSENQIVG